MRTKLLLLNTVLRKVYVWYLKTLRETKVRIYLFLCFPPVCCRISSGVHTTPLFENISHGSAPRPRPPGSGAEVADDDAQYHGAACRHHTGKNDDPVVRDEVTNIHHLSGDAAQLKQVPVYCNILLTVINHSKPSLF